MQKRLAILQRKAHRLAKNGIDPYIVILERLKRADKAYAAMVEFERENGVIRDGRVALGYSMPATWKLKFNRDGIGIFDIGNKRVSIRRLDDGFIIYEGVKPSDRPWWDIIQMMEMRIADMGDGWWNTVIYDREAALSLRCVVYQNRKLQLCRAIVLTYD